MSNVYRRRLRRLTAGPSFVAGPYRCGWSVLGWADVPDGDGRREFGNSWTLWQICHPWQFGGALPDRRPWHEEQKYNQDCKDVATEGRNGARACLNGGRDGPDGAQECQNGGREGEKGSHGSPHGGQEGQNGAQDRQNGAREGQNEPRGVEMEPKRAKTEAKRAKMEARGAKMEAKRAKMEPKRAQSLKM